MDKEAFLASGLLELYALGLTSPEESREVKQFLNAHPELKEQLKEMKNSVSNYAKQQIPQIKRANHLKVNQNVIYSAVGAFALLIGFIFFQNVKLRNQLKLNQVTKEALQDCQSDLKAIKDQDKVYAFLTHPSTEVYKIQNNSTIDNPSNIVFYYNAHLKEVHCNAIHLDGATSNQDYQVWADLDGEMVNMGVVTANEGNLQVLKFHEHPESFNITIEPKGGSKHPTVSNLIGNVII